MGILPCTSVFDCVPQNDPSVAGLVQKELVIVPAPSTPAVKTPFIDGRLNVVEQSPCGYGPIVRIVAPDDPAVGLMVMCVPSGMPVIVELQVTLGPPTSQP